MKNSLKVSKNALFNPLNNLCNANLPCQRALKKKQSAILEAVQQTAQGFYRAGAMDKATLREFGYLTSQTEVFRLDDGQWKAFLATLDAPSEPMPRLEQLLKQPSILD